MSVDANHRGLGSDRPAVVSFLRSYGWVPGMALMLLIWFSGELSYDYALSSFVIGLPIGCAISSLLMLLMRRLWLFAAITIVGSIAVDMLAGSAQIEYSNSLISFGDDSTARWAATLVLGAWIAGRFASEVRDGAWAVLCTAAIGFGVPFALTFLAHAHYAEYGEIGHHNYQLYSTLCWVCVALGAVGLIWLIVRKGDTSPRIAKRKRCVACAEYIMREASLCRHCGTQQVVSATP
jgi:hypothetical protein